MRTFFTTYSLIAIAFFFTGCGSQIFYNRQKSFSESPQYAAINSPKSYPLALLPSDQNGDGFTDAWVIIENEEGRRLELWLQAAITNKKQEASYSKACTFPLVKGGDLKSFSLASLLNNTPKQALFITSEESPDEGLILAQVAAYLPQTASPCRLLLQEKMVTRAHLMSNEGRQVKALAKYQEGYAVEKINGHEVLIKSTNPLIIPFEYSAGKLDIAVALQEEIYLPEKSGLLKIAQKRWRDLASKEVLTINKSANNSWIISRSAATPSAMVQITWSTLDEPIGNQEQSWEFLLESGEKSYHLPINVPPFTAEVAAIARRLVSQAASEKPWRQYTYLLTLPLNDKSYKLTLRHLNGEPASEAIELKQVVFKTPAN